MTQQTSFNLNNMNEKKRVFDTDGSSSANQDNKKPCKDFTIGIDFGTTNSCVAIYKDEKIKVIKNREGSYTTPSYVHYSEEPKEVVVGKVAKDRSSRSTRNTIYNAKRLIGCAFNDPEIQNNIKSWPFKVVDCNGKAVIELKYKNKERTVKPEEVSAETLSYLKLLADEHLGFEVSSAVITTPANFDTNQRRAIMEAGALAGFRKVTLLNEPTAAAITHCFQRGKKQDDQNILVFDLGGGSFDVSIINCCYNVYTVKVTCGDLHLGGEDFKQIIFQYCLEYLKDKNVDIKYDPRAINILNNLCENAKCSLSSCLSYDIELEVGNVYHTISITRNQFEKLSEKLLTKLMKIVRDCLDDAQLQKTQINDVILVGGSTNIPIVKSKVQEFFNHLNIKYETDYDQSIAIGAAIKGESTELTVTDVLSTSIEVQASGNPMNTIVSRNTILPFMKMITYVINTSKFANSGDLTLNIFQVKRRSCNQPRKLGQFHLFEKNLENKSFVIEVCIDTNSICRISVFQQMVNSLSNNYCMNAPISNVISKKKKKLYSDDQNIAELDEKDEIIDISNLHTHGTTSKKELPILIYPYPRTSTSVQLYSSTLSCLSKGAMINDLIVDYYIEHLKIAHPNVCKKVNIFSAWTYKLDIKNLKKKPNDLISHMYSWDYHILPINSNLHWYLLIIQLQNKDKKVFVLDSLPKKNYDEANKIYHYFNMKDETVDKLDDKKVKFVQVPLQDNFVDCGLFMLRNIEEILKLYPAELDKIDLTSFYSGADIETMRYKLKARIENDIKNYQKITERPRTR